MTTLAERIAAKRAAQATAEKPAEAVETVTVSKPMTFAEKLAAKRAEEAASAPAPAPAVSPLASLESKPAEADQKPMTFAEKLAAKKAAISSVQDSPAVKREFVMDPSRLPEDSETAQDLMDISRRIFELEDLIDDDLTRAMSELKVALRKNPAACALLLDEDVGKMVSSLRRMSKVASVAAEKAPKKGAKTKPKAKEVALTPEQLAEAWDEL